MNEYLKNKGQLNSDLGSLPKYEKDFRSIQRQQKIKETLYLYLLQKREENQIAMSMGIGNAKIVDKAFSHNSIIFPKPRLFYSGALLLSIFVFVLILYLRNLPKLVTI